MASNRDSECTMSNDQPIYSFLKFADLGKYEAIFQSFGVHKFEHLNDVQVEDLHKFGKFVLLGLLSKLKLFINR